MDKIYIIDGKEYKLKPTTLKDWKEINKMLKGLAQNPVLLNGKDIVVSASAVINELLEKDLIEKFLGLILQPVNNPGNVESIEDVVLVEVTADFFMSKKSLIENIAGSLADFKEQKTKR